MKTHASAAARFQTLQHNGKSVIYLDYSNTQRDESAALNALWHKSCLAAPQGSLLLLMNLDNAWYDTELVNQWKFNGVQYQKHVRRSAIIGVSPLFKMGIEGVRQTAAFFDQPLHQDQARIFGDKSEALHWLTGN